MTREIEGALEEEAEVSITTYSPTGRPGRVHIWFVYTEGKVFIATGRDSRKVQKLLANSTVRLTFPGKTGDSIASIEGKARVCREKELVQRVAPRLNHKYRGAWGPDSRMVQRLLGEDIVLVEVTPIG